MKYITTIDDASVYGITAAREAYNLTQWPAEVEITPAIPATADTPEVPAVMGPNPGILNTNEAYLDFVLQSAIQSWCRQYAPTAPVPEVPPTTVNGVPQQVTRRQAKTVMELTPNAEHGNLWAAALAAANGIPDAQARVVTVNYLQESLYFEYDKVVAMAGQLLGMAEEQVAQMFVAASQL